MKKLQISLLALAAVALLASDAAAQTQGKFMIEGRGGYALIGGDLTEAVKPGPVFGLGLGYGLSKKLSIFVTGDYGIHSGESLANNATSLPDWKITSFFGWLGVNLISGMDEVPDLIGLIGVGGMMYNIDEGNPNYEPFAFEDKTFVTIAAQLKYTYWASEKFAIELQAQGNYSFTDFKDDEGTELVKGTWYFPITAGFIFAL